MQDLHQRIRDNPKFKLLVSSRNSLALILSIGMLVVYYGYILLIAFNKEWLKTKLGEGFTMSIGIPLGLGVILFTIIVTWVFVNKANSTYDALSSDILQDTKK